MSQKFLVKGGDQGNGRGWADLNAKTCVERDGCVKGEVEVGRRDSILVLGLRVGDYL